MTLKLAYIKSKTKRLSKNKTSHITLDDLYKNIKIFDKNERVKNEKF